MKFSFNNAKTRGLIYQTVLLVVFVALVVWIVANTRANMDARNMQTGFDFLQQPAGFGILYSPFVQYDAAIDNYLTTFWVGVSNTILVSVLGIIAATIFGFIIGLLRLSNNYLISRLAAIYIETFRNIPLLLQIMFWYFAFLVPSLPSVREAISFFGGAVTLSNQGLYVPAVMLQDGSLLFALLFAAVIGGVIAYRRYARRIQRDTGKQLPMFLVSAGALLVGFIIAYQITTPFAYQFPERTFFSFEGGWPLIPELVALWLALSIYTSAFIAEVVRAGILSVPKGQTEASLSLGLSRVQTIRFIIVPQALRVIIPPQTNQYLNLAKNSSLATAVGYPDLVAVFAGTALNQVGRAIEIIFMTMAVYLFISLSISVLMNIYNKRIALVER